MKYVCAALIVVVLALGWFYYGANSELTVTKASLATAKAVNDENAKSFARLERSMSISERAITGWDDDRTTIAQLRATTRQSIREAMKDEMFKIWATGAVPSDGWRMLRQSTDQNGSGAKNPSRNSDAGVPGDRNPGKRQ